VPVAVETVIFDFDGLLMDTESTSLASWQFEWRQHGLELDVADFFADHGGDVTEERYARLASAVGPAFAREASHARRIAYREGLHQHLGLSAGIPQWLEEAAVLGLRLAVASSSHGDWVRHHLSRAGVLERFEVIASGEEVPRPKPDPAVYELALRRLAVRACDAVAVEDTPHGVAAARGAGLRCIAIPNPHADMARFGAASIVLPTAAHRPLPAVLARLECPPAAVGCWAPPCSGE
jgi:beta-phosphoglucomutase-like phosphatase (HAD superfamily)